MRVSVKSNLNSQAPDVPELAHQDIFQLSRLTVNSYLNTVKKISPSFKSYGFYENQITTGHIVEVIIILYKICSIKTDLWFSCNSVEVRLSYNWNLNFQLFMDMIYQVNQAELGINQVLQLIELTYGEGKSFHDIFF